MKIRIWAPLAVTLALISAIVLQPQRVAAGAQQGAASQLQIIGKDGKPAGFVPLKHTQIKTEISGFVARISVIQVYENVLPDAVEAIYVFPLPHDSAVDGMTMKVGDREIQAVIKEREEARKIYDAARNAGHTAALLDQERPNIFTQSVANIPPGSKVEITLSVLELLKYESGIYEFAFPLVVGPRYIPGSPSAAAENSPGLRDVALKTGGEQNEQRGTMPDTEKVPDASKISPPVAGVHTSDDHAGHHVSFEIALAAGVPIMDVESTSHKIFADRTGADSFHIQLVDDAVLPNKDFILKYKVAGPGISDAVLAHSDKSGGYFTLILQPPERVPDDAAVPRELIFVVDTSGSMWGFPLETAKKTIARALDNLRPHETFNLITFSGDTRILFPGPVPATSENIAAAKKVLAGAYGSGGTEMMKAIRIALGDDVGSGKPAGGTTPVRIVCFMTDGYVGDDAEIVAAVKKHPEARVFSFGIGTSVNRFLLAKMAEEGHGDVEFVTNPNEAQAAADRFYDRVHSPVLTNISIEWKGLPVAEVYPAHTPDLFSVKPVIITGRYTGAAKGTVVIRGIRAGGQFVREVPVEFPAENSNNAALEKIWARRKVEDLMSQDWSGIQSGQSKHKAEIIEVGLKHSLATQYTSFVAVEEKTVIQDGKPVRIEVPVELPENVSKLAVPGSAPLINATQAQVTNTFSGTALYSFAGVQENEGIDRLALFGPGLAAPSPAKSGTGSFGTSGANQVVEVSADAPTIDSSTAQVTHTFEGDLLNPKANADGESIAGSVKRHADEKARRRAARLKLSSDLQTMVDCSKKPSVNKTPGKCSMPASGMLEIEVHLTAGSSDTEQKLTQAGLKIKGGAGTAVLTGEVPVSKLEDLAAVDDVKSVSLVKNAEVVQVVPPISSTMFT